MPRKSNYDKARQDIKQEYIQEQALTEAIDRAAKVALRLHQFRQWAPQVIINSEALSLLRVAELIYYSTLKKPTKKVRNTKEKYADI